MRESVTPLGVVEWLIKLCLKDIKSSNKRNRAWACNWSWSGGRECVMVGWWHLWCYCQVNTHRKQDEWRTTCGLGWPIALKLPTSPLNQTKYSTEDLWFSYQTTKLSLWGWRLLKRQLMCRFTRCSKASWSEPKKPGRPGREPHPPARIYKISGVWSDIHNSGGNFSKLPAALCLTSCPSTAPQEIALPGPLEDAALVQWPKLPRLPPLMLTAWVASVCPVPSKLALGSWTTVRRPAVGPRLASQPVTSELHVSPTLARWPALDKLPVFPTPAQLPAADRSPLSLVDVNPWEVSPVSANQWEESLLSASQPVGSPGRTSSPVCPAAEEPAKCVGASERIKTPRPASCFQDLPACCLSLNSSS